MMASNAQIVKENIFGNTPQMAENMAAQTDNSSENNSEIDSMEKNCSANSLLVQ